MRRIATAVLWLVALFYAYGALIHVLNILSLSGFDWSEAPLKWQVLDLVYLVLDLLVAIGFIAGWTAGYGAFYLAAGSQVLLYTLFRDWVTAVPEAFAISPEQESYLTNLVIFHLLTLVLVTAALVVRRRTGS